MMRLWPVLLLVGCGLDEDGFREQQAIAACEREAVCGELEPDCGDVPVPAASELFVCTFDGDAAQACLDAIPAAECADGGPSFANPDVCTEVFVDCENVSG